MQIERLELPDGQWADLHRRPTHGQMKEIERLTRKAVQDDEYLSVEDANILTLITEWHVLDKDGNWAPLKREAIDGIPQDTISHIMAEVEKIIESTRPNLKARRR